MRATRRKATGGFAIDRLEDRRMMSASLFGDTTKVWDDQSLAVVASPKALITPRAVASPYAPVVGAWKGTSTTAVSGAVARIAMNITTQRAGAATGTFSLGPATNNHTVLSTATVGRQTFCVILQGKGFYGGLTAAVSTNGKYIVGRWAVNGPGGWKTGTLTMTRP